MAKRVFERGAAVIDFNMTPMIDVTFQLILFFILVGQVASDALAKMELAKPEKSQAIKTELTSTGTKVIINIVSKAAAQDKEVKPFLAGQVDRYVVGGKRFGVGDEDAIVRVLERELAKLPETTRSEFFVEVRADRRVFFAGVEPIIETAAGLANVIRPSRSQLQMPSPAQFRMDTYRR